MTASASSAPAQPRMDVSLMAALIGNFLVRLDGGMVGQLLAWYLKDVNERSILEVTATTYGVLTSVFYISELLFAPLMGAKSDQHGNRTLLLVSPLIGLVAVIVAGMAAFGTHHGLAGIGIANLSLVLLLLGLTRLLQGFAAATSIPSILSYLSARTEGSLALRGRVMSIFEVTTAIGLLVGPIVGVQLWKFTGAWGFIITGLVFLLSAVFFWRMRDDRVSRHQSAAPVGEGFISRLRRVLGRRDLLGFIPAWLAINGIVGLWATHMIYQMIAGKKDDGQFLTGSFSPDIISASMGAFGLLFCIGIIGWGFLLGRLREIAIMRLSLIGLGILLAAVFGINALGDRPLLLWSLLALVAIGLVLEAGFAPAAITYLARLSATGAHDRGLVMGVYSVILGLGQFIGIFLGGPFADAGGVYGILFLTLLLSLIGGYSVARLTPPEELAEGQPDRAQFGLHA